MMDQANTLRALLKQNRPSMLPVLGELDSPYMSLLCRGMLSEVAQQEQRVVLFDAGAICKADGSVKSDLLDSLVGRKGLEDLTVSLDEYRHVIPSRRGLACLAKQEVQVASFFKQLHRLPVTVDHMMVSLPTGAWQLATQLGAGQAFTWLVEPSSKSVTQTFQSLRRIPHGNTGINHRIIVAGVRDASEADNVFSTLQEVSSPYLDSPLQYCGHLPKLNNNQITHMSASTRVAVSRVAKALCASSELACA